MFNIASNLDALQYSSLGHHGRRPVIGITGNYDEEQLKLMPGYFRSIERAGGVAVVIPPRRQPDAALIDLLESLDGLLLSGGADLNPLFVGEEPVPALHSINAERDAFELALVRMAYDRQIPMLGICRGIQMMAAALDGTVIQDLATAMPDQPLLKHSQQASRGVATHSVRTEEGSLLRQLFGEQLAVNSFHHQAVGEPGPRFRVSAKSPDGVVEAIESTDFRWMVGVQWHPECFLPEGDEKMIPLFRRFVEEAETYGRVRHLHEATLTLDSHCDTPMWFDKGVDLYRRDPQLLVDFQKMREGGLDASIMVAYIPQGELTDEAHTAATAMADDLFSTLDYKIFEADGGARLARTPQELWRNKADGVRSVMLGIENGYALGRDLRNIGRYADKGVVYITLCHNGDNLICDSARRSTGRNGGLSDYGREVIEEMNRQGIMVDLSHAAEASFYQAIEASRTPIVCSHASSRALCDHPRNLTDDQLRALSETGGVAQVTMYHGFLRPETADGQPTATVDDAVRHLLHMIEVAGIDHVGIGTDFDGDGGIPGCADASELRHFTALLMKQGLSQPDLQKIWGGNFLRVMTLCQAEKG